MPPGDGLGDLIGRQPVGEIDAAHAAVRLVL
jgi:hypothetical protein